MPHAIVAIVTKDKIDQEKAASFDLVVRSENNFTIIGLDGCHSEYWAKEYGIYDECGDYFGHPDGVFINITLRLATEIGITKFALIATDYFGGEGVQAGRVFENEKEVFLEGYSTKNILFTGISINEALSYIGVKKGKRTDEFDAINLSKYRSFDGAYTKYEEECDSEEIPEPIEVQTPEPKTTSSFWSKLKRKWF